MEGTQDIFFFKSVYSNEYEGLLFNLCVYFLHSSTDMYATT